MRLHTLVALMALSPLAAQGSLQSSPPTGHWTFGLIRQAPDFTCSYDKTNDSGPDTTFDTVKDLGLTKDTTGTGAVIEYEGRRFLLHLAAYSQNYKGDQINTNDVVINGQTIPAGSQVKSELKLKDYELDWTIKVWRWDAAYLGLDLGINTWNLDLNAVGTTVVEGVPGTETATGTVTVPIPQVGASFGAHLGAWVDLRAYYHFLNRSGASYHRSGAIVRFFPLKWLGVQANIENEGFKVPKGSIDEKTTLDATKNGAGFGIVARF